MKKILLVLALLVAFTPWVSATYTVTENRPAIIPYTVQEQIQVPTLTYESRPVVVDDGGLARFKAGVYLTGEEYMAAYRSVKPERWGSVNQPSLESRTETRSVTRYRVSSQPVLVSKRGQFSPIQLLFGATR